MEEQYIDFIIAPYCLAKLLWALDLNKIYLFYITQVDDDLMVRIPKSYLEKIVYPPRPSKGEICSPNKGDDIK